MTREVPIPAAVAALPRDHAGRPIPWFVEWVDGKPDPRIASVSRLVDAVRFDLCWVCGRRRGRHVAFVIGPMCSINRISAEPPCHYDCAVYSARACPFLSTPTMHRRERHMPEDKLDPPGVMITRNPGVALVWCTKTFTVERFAKGLLFTIGDPVKCEWFAEGRPASRAEVMDSIESGLPALQAVARHDGPAACRDLDARYQAALALVPAR